MNGAKLAARALLITRIARTRSCRAQDRAQDYASGASPRRRAHADIRWPCLLFGTLPARVRIQPFEPVRVDRLHHPRREHPLKDAPDPPGSVPGRGDLHERRTVARGTVVVVTRLEPVSDSVRTRPGSGSSTLMRYSRVRPPAVTLNRVTVPAPTPPDSTWKSENAGGRKCGW